MFITIRLDYKYFMSKHTHTQQHNGNLYLEGTNYTRPPKSKLNRKILTIPYSINNK